MGPSLLQPGRQSHCQQCPQCRTDTTLRLKHAHMLNLVTTISPCTNTILNQVGRPCPFCPLDTERTCKNPCPFRVQRTKRTKRTRPTDTDRVKIRPTLEFFKNPCPFRVQRTKRTRPTGGRAVVGWAPYSQNPTDFGIFQKIIKSMFVNIFEKFQNTQAGRAVHYHILKFRCAILKNQSVAVF